MENHHIMESHHMSLLIEEIHFSYFDKVMALHHMVASHHIMELHHGVTSNDNILSYDVIASYGGIPSCDGYPQFDVVVFYIHVHKYKTCLKSFVCNGMTSRKISTLLLGG